MYPPFRRLTHSLVFRIVVMGVVFLMLGSLVRFIVASGVLREGVQANAAQQQESLAQYVAQDIDAKVNARLRYLEETAAHLPAALLQQPLELQNWLAQRHAANPLFSLGLVAIPIDGNGVIAEHPVVEGRKQLNFAERDWFIGARDSGKPVIGKPVIGRAANQPAVQMATPLRDSSGRVTGILMGVTALGTPGFLDIIQNNKVGEAGTLILFSPLHKMIVTATDPQMRLRALPEPGINRLLDQAMSGWRGTGITINSQGIEDLAAFVSVPGAQWVVVARIPTSEIYASITAMQKQNLRLSLAAGAVLTLLLAWMTVWMLKPLKESARQMRAMAVGSTGLAPLPVVRSDEVGEMVESFNLLIAQLQKAESTMAYAAHHDALTGLPNRRFVLSQMRQSVALAIRQKASLAVLFIDLDGFKAVNDEHGHKVGDMLLQQVAQRLRDSVRASDLVGRLGGDEFLVLLTDCDDPADATASAEKTIALLSAPYLLDGATAVIGASIGTALLPLHADTAEGLVNAADDAMYVAKREGRETCRMATSGYATPATS